jgi:hypothetical protein
MTRTSASSNTLGTGSKTFTYTSSSNLGWLIGTRLRISNTTSNWMEGPITAVSATSVTINSDLVSGSGTFTSWNLTIAGERGQPGVDGADGQNGADGVNGIPGAAGAEGPTGPTGPNSITTSTSTNGTGFVKGNGSVISFAASIVNADIDASAGIVDTKLATISTADKVSNSATTATSSNNINTIVLRDGSGNFSAGTITTSNLNVGTSVSGWEIDGSSTATLLIKDLNNITRMAILDTGRVGIGTTSPSHELHVSASAPRVTLEGTNAGSNIGYRFVAVDSGSTSRTGGYYFQPITGTNQSYLGLTATDSAYQMVVRADGNVGIGTDNPGFPLDIQRNTTGTTIAARFLNNNSANTTSKNTAIVFDINNTSGVAQRAAQILVYPTSSAATSAGMIISQVSGGSLIERARFDSAGNFNVGAVGSDNATLARVEGRTATIGVGTGLGTTNTQYNNGTGILFSGPATSGGAITSLARVDQIYQSANNTELSFKVMISGALAERAKVTSTGLRVPGSGSIASSLSSTQLNLTNSVGASTTLDFNKIVFNTGTSFAGTFINVSTGGDIMNFGGEYAAYSVSMDFDDGSVSANKFIGAINETRNNEGTFILRGTQAQYDAIGTKSTSTIYFITA